MEDKGVGQSTFLFSYGIINAGKTYIMMGEDMAKDMIHGTCLSKNHGIIPRALNHIFSKINNNAGVKHDLYELLWYSCFDIYNEQLFDLLPKEKKGFQSNHILDREKSLRIREGRGGCSYVERLVERHVSNFLMEGTLLMPSNANAIHPVTKSTKIRVDCMWSSKFNCLLINIFRMKKMMTRFVVRHRDTTLVKTAWNQILFIKGQECGLWIWLVVSDPNEQAHLQRLPRQKKANYINSSLMKLMRYLQTIRYNNASS